MIFAPTFRHAASAALRKAVRNPFAALRSLHWITRNRKLRALLRLSEYVEPATRGRFYRRALRVANRLLRRRADHSIGAPLKALALWELGREEDAMAFIQRVRPNAPDDTRVRLGIFCAAIGRPPPKQLRLSELRSRTRAAAMTAELAWRSGRLLEARQMIADGRRLKPDDTRLQRISDRVEGELRALQPGWLPTTDGREPAARPGPTVLRPERGRILHFLTNSLPFKQVGYTVRAQQIARAQKAASLDPHMVTRAGFPMNEGFIGAQAEETVDGVPYYRLAPELPPGMRLDQLLEMNVGEASRLIERLRPAAIHPTSNHPNAQVALALRARYGLPVIYEVRGFLEETWLSKMGPDAASSDKYRLSRANELACMQAADAIVTLSETMKADMVARGVEANKIVVVPNAVEIERFPVPVRDDRLAARLGLRQGEIVIGYISSFVEYEGIRYLIEAGAHLRARGRPVKMLLVGDGNQRAALEQRARELSVEDVVIFTGRVPHQEILNYYSIIDVFVIPRTSARVSQLVTPLKPYEAMATQRAIVVSKVGALLEIVREGETGLAFEPEDSEDLADVVEPLLADPLERARLGEAARRWVIENRTWTQNGQRYRALYERLSVA